MRPIAYYVGIRPHNMLFPPSGADAMLRTVKCPRGKLELRSNKSMPNFTSLIRYYKNMF